MAKPAPVQMLPQTDWLRLIVKHVLFRRAAGFSESEIAIRLTPATHCHALPVGGR
jgi:hypothetical protein